MNEIQFKLTCDEAMSLLAEAVVRKNLVGGEYAASASLSITSVDGKVDRQNIEFTVAAKRVPV